MARLHHAARSARRFLWIGNVFQPDATFTLSLKNLFGGSNAIVSIDPDGRGSRHGVQGARRRSRGPRVRHGQRYIPQFNTKTDWSASSSPSLPAWPAISSRKSMPADGRQRRSAAGRNDEGHDDLHDDLLRLSLRAPYNAAFGLYSTVTMAMGMALQMILKKVDTPERLGRKSAATRPMRRRSPTARKNAPHRRRKNKS